MKTTKVDLRKAVFYSISGGLLTAAFGVLGAQSAHAAAPTLVDPDGKPAKLEPAKPTPVPAQAPKQEAVAAPLKDRNAERQDQPVQDNPPDQHDAPRKGTIPTSQPKGDGGGQAAKDEKAGRDADLAVRRSNVQARQESDAKQQEADRQRQANTSRQREKVIYPEATPDSPRAVRMRADAEALAADNKAAAAPSTARRGGGGTFGEPSQFAKTLQSVNDGLNSGFEDAEQWAADKKAHPSDPGPKPARRIDDLTWDSRNAAANAEQIAAGVVGGVTGVIRLVDDLNRPETAAAMDKSIQQGWDKLSTDPGGAVDDVARGAGNLVKEVADHPLYYLGTGLVPGGGGRAAAGRVVADGTKLAEHAIEPHVGAKLPDVPDLPPPAGPRAGVGKAAPEPVVPPAADAGRIVPPAAADVPPRLPPAATKVAPQRFGPGSAHNGEFTSGADKNPYTTVPAQPTTPPPVRPLGKKAQQAKKNAPDLLPLWQQHAPDLIDETTGRAAAKAAQQAGYPPLPLTYKGKPYGPKPITGARTVQPKSMGELRGVNDVFSRVDSDGNFPPTPRTKAQKAAYIAARLAGGYKYGTEPLRGHGPGAAHFDEIASGAHKNPYTDVPKAGGDPARYPVPSAPQVLPPKAPRVIMTDSAGESVALPVHEIESALYPGVADNFDYALVNGKSPIVGRITGKGRIRRHRGAAQAGELRPDQIGTAPGGVKLSWEEYPFASTKEGGKGAQLRLIPRDENSAHGLLSLWPFLRDNGIQDGDLYYVRTK